MATAVVVVAAVVVVVAVAADTQDGSVDTVDWFNVCFENV
jgi:hypothetical protein